MSWMLFRERRGPSITGAETRMRLADGVTPQRGLSWNPVAMAVVSILVDSGTGRTGTCTMAVPIPIEDWAVDCCASGRFEAEEAPQPPV